MLQRRILHQGLCEAESKLLLLLLLPETTVFFFFRLFSLSLSDCLVIPCRALLIARRKTQLTWVCAFPPSCLISLALLCRIKRNRKGEAKEKLNGKEGKQTQTNKAGYGFRPSRVLVVYKGLAPFLIELFRSFFVVPFSPKPAEEKEAKNGNIEV